MDIERTMEFIVENLAAVTVRQQKTEQSIRGLRTIVQGGMRILVRLEQHQNNMDTKIAALADAQIRTEESLSSLAAAQKELAAAQKRTDQKFERWLDSMNKGPNGHKKRSGS